MNEPAHTPPTAPDPLDELKTREQLVEEVRSLRRQVAELQQALEDRKVIERAKGAAMKRLGVDERAAYRRLRQLASREQRKMVEVARSVLDAEAVFLTLEQAGLTGEVERERGGRR